MKLEECEEEEFSYWFKINSVQYDYVPLYREIEQSYNN